MIQGEQMLIEALGRKLTANLRRRTASPAISSGQRATLLTQQARSDASSVTGLTDGALLFQACHLVSQMPLVPLEVFGSPFHLEKDMARTYEYWTVKDGEDISINLTVAYYSARKGNFSSQAADPDEYFGHCEINWESKDDTSFMTESEIAQMEEWLVNEHSEYLADLEYFD